MRERAYGGATERGSALLAVLLIGIGLTWIVSALLVSTRELAIEYRAHRQVVCARYAALSGLAVADPSSVRSLPLFRFGTGNDASEAAVALQLVSPGSCVLTSEGRCGSARYPVQRRVDADFWCG